MPSYVSYRFTGTKLLPKKTDAISTSTYPQALDLSAGGGGGATGGAGGSAGGKPPADTLAPTKVSTALVDGAAAESDRIASSSSIFLRTLL